MMPRRVTPFAAMTDRRRRVHELVLALMAQRSDLELLDDHGLAASGSATNASEAGNWLERNRRLLQRYQALVRTAVTLEALIDQEVGGTRLGGPDTTSGIATNPDSAAASAPEQP